MTDAQLVALFSTGPEWSGIGVFIFIVVFAAMWFGMYACVAWVIWHDIKRRH